MADENSDRDLFGEPYQACERGRGRPEHIPTRETTNRVILGFARKWKPKQVALSIGISVPTLRKYYFSHVERRDALALMMESVQLGRLNDQAEKGNVAAEKELMKALERGRRESVAATFAATPPASKPEKLGKKEAASKAAKDAKGKFAPPPAPLLN